MLTRKGLVVGIILSLLIPCVIPSIGQHSGKKTIQSSSQVDILYVGGGGSGNYTRIQDAINDSITGGTVYVYNDSSRIMSIW